MSADQGFEAVPLCVDLDGTLTPVDTMVEAVLRLSKAAPLQALATLTELRRGLAAFKDRVARQTRTDAVTLPWDGALLSWLSEEKRAGRRLVLVTASAQRVAEAVAEELELFDEVIASDAHTNLSGEAKRAALVARFGERGYDYCGNSSADLAVWRSARRAIVVNAGRRVAAAAQQLGNVARVFPGEQQGSARKRLGYWLRAMRPHQWVKNLLVFAPLAAAHRVADPMLWLPAIAAFIAFGCCASSGYLVNDLLDVEADRRHPRKRMRPFAAGRLSAAHGVVAAAALLVPAALLASWVGAPLVLALIVYYLGTLAYSLHLKRHALIDVMLLSGLYTLRILAGSAATGIPPSPWLLAFSGFIFLSLGIVKRMSELKTMRASGELQPSGRGYEAADLPLLTGLGSAAGYSAVTVLALYVNSQTAQELYRHPRALWLVCPLVLYWISRVLLITHRGAMHDDPLVYAIKDRFSLGVAALVVLVAALAA